MATLDANGVLFYEVTDPISPLQTLLNTGQQSISDALSARARLYKSVAGTAPSSPVAGDHWYQTDTEALGIYNGSVWRFWDNKWQAYTATLSGFGVGTTGSPVAETLFHREGDLVRMRYRFVFGTNGVVTFAGGGLVTLPINALASQALMAYGTGAIGRGSAGGYLSVPRVENASQIRLTVGAGPMSDVAGTHPNGTAWAAGDFIAGEISYRIA